MPAYTIWVASFLREPDEKITIVRNILEKYNLDTKLRRKVAECGDEYWTYLTPEALPNNIINEINSVPHVRLKIPEIMNKSS